MQQAALPLGLLIAASFTSGLGIRAVDPLLHLIATEFGQGVPEAGLAVASFGLAYGLAQPVLGPLGDRLGKLRLIALSLSVYAMVSVACAAAPSLGALIALRAVAGAAAGGMIPVAIALIGDRTPFAIRQPTLARLSTGFVLANLLSGPAGGILGEWLGWRAVFLCLAACGAVVAVLLWRVVDRPETRETSLSVVLGRYATLLRRPASRRLLLFAASEGCFAMGITPYLGALLTERYGLSYAQAGLCLGAVGLGALLYTRLAGRLLRRFGERGLLKAGFGVVVWMAIVAIQPPVWALVAANVFGGFSIATFHGVLQARGSEMLPEARATGMSCFAFSLFMGQALGALIGSAAILWFGYGALFAFGAAGMAALVAAVLVLPLGDARQPGGA